ncbi:hypothetical protein EK21DRAFT_26087, partial [Setomelanomma holmii]
FGPRLEYYCAQRGFRLGVDHKFIYKYPAPTPEKPQRMRYFDIAHKTTPTMLRDKEYLGAAFQDGDTIYVVKRQTRVPDVAKEKYAEALMAQVDCQRINIQNGETTIYQDPEVNREWYKDTEKTVSFARKRIAELEDSLTRQNQATKMLADAVASLENGNHVLEAQIAQLRYGQMSSTALPWPGY